MDLVFEVTLWPNLAPEERDPFATSYLTSDVACEPEFRQTELFGQRLWKKPPATARDTCEFTHQFRVDTAKTTVADDTAYCVQCFCELQNHKEERCSHRCGFAAFGIRGMCDTYTQTGRATFWAHMRDHGPGFSKRGVATVRVLEPAALVRFAEAPATGSPSLLVGAPTDAGPTSAYQVSREYFLAINEVLDHHPPTDPAIRVPKLPIYTLSGGATMPSCAFIQFRTPPPAPVEYFANALAVALRRNLPRAPSDEHRVDVFCREQDHSSAWDWKASVLMDAATLLATSFPYMYDYGISHDGTRLVAADEFVRTGRLTLALDCEDGAVETLVFLWHILRMADAPSRVLAAARRVRMQYATTICLKSVTRPSQSNGDDEDEDEVHRRRGYAAHASCDMVPLAALRRMLPRGTPEFAALQAIVDERADALLPDAVASRLRVVVGETTGYVRSYVTPEARSQPWARVETRRMIAPIFRAMRMVATEDLARGSAFYRHAVSALVHDTLVSAAAQKVARAAGVEWLLPQLVYGMRGGASGLTYGAPHPRYLVCGDDLIAFPVRPVTAAVQRVTEQLSKFEHPLPSLTGPPRDPARVVPDYAVIKALLHDKTFAVQSSAADAADAEVTACVPLHHVTTEKARELIEAFGRSDALLRAVCHIDFITEDTATLVVHMTFAK